jgi:hypothetical protein
MAVSRTAWVDSESSGHTLDWATVRRPYLLVPGPVTDQASWTVVIRHARWLTAALIPPVVPGQCRGRQGSPRGGRCDRHLRL